MTTLAQIWSGQPPVCRESDWVTRFHGVTGLPAVPRCPLWGNAPVLNCLVDPSLGFYFFDDFITQASATSSDYNVYTAVNDGATGTNAFQNVAGGIFNLVTAAADNDYSALTTTSEIFNLGLSKKVWFEARIKLAEATTNDSAWWVGMTDTTTTGGFQADALGPLADYDGCLFWKDEDTLSLSFETSNGATQNTGSAIASVVSDTWVRVGFYCDGTATTSVITPYYEVTGVSGAPMIAGTAKNLTLASMTASKLVFGVKAGPGAAAETLQIDYIRALQLR